MSLVNVAYAPVLTWAHSSLNALEEQALVPMLGEDPIELGLKGNEEAFLKVVKTNAVYQRLFAAAFPQGDEVDLEKLVKGISAFERSIVSIRSPYDRYRWDGDTAAISASAKRGELLFSSSERAGCFQCHGGWNFSSVRIAGGRASTMEDGGPFFNTGVSEYKAPNRGLYERTNRDEDIGRFRAPTLRNIALTAPYMHDGSFTTLEAVLEHYASGGKMNHVNKTRILRPFQMTEEDKRDLIEFLSSLTDEDLVRDLRWSDPWPKSR